MFGGIGSFWTLTCVCSGVSYVRWCGYPCLVKSWVPSKSVLRIERAKRAGIVAYGMARNWTTFSGEMSPVMGPGLQMQSVLLSDEYVKEGTWTSSNWHRVLSCGFSAQEFHTKEEQTY